MSLVGQIYQTPVVVSRFRLLQRYSNHSFTPHVPFTARGQAQERPHLLASLQYRRC
jgi:hypothetical protein